MIKYFIEKIRLLSNSRKEPYLLYYKILGFYPHTLSYYDLALLHKSLDKKSEDGRKLNNERLEFLGDAVLEAIVSDILYARYGEKEEGFLSSTRSKMVQRQSLNAVSHKLGLDALILSKIKAASFNNLSGNALEAFIGAIYLDRGYLKSKEFIERKVIPLMDMEKLITEEVNFKSRMLEWAQRNHLQVQYQVEEEVGQKKGEISFYVKLYINGCRVADARGRSKKEAQQKVSQFVLKDIQRSPLFWKKIKNMNTTASAERIQ